jgi:hypothetical protein
MYESVIGESYREADSILDESDASGCTSRTCSIYQLQDEGGNIIFLTSWKCR